MKKSGPRDEVPEIDGILLSIKPTGKLRAASLYRKAKEIAKKLGIPVILLSQHIDKEKDG